MKLFDLAVSNRTIMSPPARGRGLKRSASTRVKTLQSRPPRGGVD